MTHPSSDPRPVRLRAALDQVPGYKAGRPAPARTDLVTYKISSNENPFPPLPSVVAVVQDAVANINRYPDMTAAEMAHRMADTLGVDPDALAFGTGSVGLLGQLVQITCDAGDEVVFAWRSFEAYPILVALAGAVSVPVPNDAEGRHDLDAILAAITDRTRLLLLCTPNNPTGPALRTAEVEAFLRQVPSDVLVVLDEAYLEFVTAPDAPDAVALWRAHPNVAVLRSFSKAYGLAGLRVGYAIAHPEVAAALRKAAVPFGVSHLAQVAVVASLDAHAELQERVDSLVAERTRVLNAVTAIWPQVPDSQGNFVWLPLGERTAAFAAACEQAGLVVRAFDGDGVRASVAEPEANDRLVEVLQTFLAG